jgi:sugar lactone lactonase YvrE
MPLIALAAVPLVFGTAMLEPAALGQPSGSQINPGDILYADSGNSVEGGFIIKVDPNSGQETVISSGGLLQLPFAPIIDSTGQIIVSDSGRLVRINPNTGSQTVIADNSRGLLGLPYGMALSPSGNILVANLRAVMQVNPANGQIQTVSAGGHFVYPLDVAVASNGHLLVLNIAFPSQIIRVNPQTGVQRVVSQGGYLKSPQAIAVSGNDIYVTDVATQDGNFGIGRIVHVDGQTGRQTVVSTGGYLVGPVGIALDGNGQLVVGDPYTVNPQSRDIADGGYDGAIIRIEPLTGTQTLLARGQAGYLNPRGVTVVWNSTAGNR